jgi:hypothetical protein
MREIPLLKVYVTLANGRLVEYEVSNLDCHFIKNGQPYELYLTDRDELPIARFRANTDWVRVIFEAPKETTSQP